MGSVLTSWSHDTLRLIDGKRQEKGFLVGIYPVLAVRARRCPWNQDFKKVGEKKCPQWHEKVLKTKSKQKIHIIDIPAYFSLRMKSPAAKKVTLQQCIVGWSGEALVVKSRYEKTV
ncbi:hypothetical protein AVEN_85594-1 [Araneus ventricosus]|uniref:Uncharacterized protein n=1 Tax=Araneus ventricosus TaxID=182803 RepID=A0A4Y2LGG4_ARAVE|nr:hypothetical protein AVEN_85594-1 [Araneus ventricosus]